MADAVLVAYAHCGGATEALARDLLAAGKQIYTRDHPASSRQVAAGAAWVYA